MPLLAIFKHELANQYITTTAILLRKVSHFDALAPLLSTSNPPQAISAARILDLIPAAMDVTNQNARTAENESDPAKSNSDSAESESYFADSELDSSESECDSTENGSDSVDKWSDAAERGSDVAMNELNVGPWGPKDGLGAQFQSLHHAVQAILETHDLLRRKGLLTAPPVKLIYVLCNIREAC